MCVGAQSQPDSAWTPGSDFPDELVWICIKTKDGTIGVFAPFEPQTPVSRKDEVADIVVAWIMIGD